MSDILLKELKKYEDKWVAILEPEERVVGSGEDASEAKRAAEKNGYKNIILFRVLPFRSGYAPFV